MLEVDHIYPAASGGDNSPENLITACFNCNRGKGARKLTDAAKLPASLKAQAAEAAEREAQIEGFYIVLEAKKQRVSREVDRVDAVYRRFVSGYKLSESARVSVRQFIEKLDAYAVEEAMESACNRWSVSTDRIFKYFCGICWNKIKESGQ